MLVNGIPSGKHLFVQDGQVFKIGRVEMKFLSGTGTESLCFAEMYRRDTTDFLTNVYNKAFFTQSLQKEVIRAQRYKRKLSLVVIDLDKFGEVNKSYGQLAGDAVLQQAAAAMKQSVRATDILGRVGGEEFAVIFPETELKEARELAERLRKSLEESLCIYHEHTLRITMSAGVAALESKMLPDDLFAAANLHTKAAKHKGRNRVEG